MKRFKSTIGTISTNITDIKKSVTAIKKNMGKKTKDKCESAKKIEDCIKTVSPFPIWMCIIIVILAVILVGVICFCVCKKIIDTNNGYLLLLFFLALLCVAGGLTVICVLRCSAIKKQALLTYAYDKALDKLEEVKDTDEIDGSIEVKELQNNNVLQTTKTKRKDYKKTVTKIFQAYCHNITAK